MPDFYAELRVERDATSEAISAAFRRRSLALHPDRPCGSKTAFQRLQRAHQVLSDPASRAKYDKYGSEEGTSGDSMSETVALLPFFGAFFVVGVLTRAWPWAAPVGGAAVFAYTDEKGAARRRAGADPLPVVLASSAGCLAGLASAVAVALLGRGLWAFARWALRC